MKKSSTLLMIILSIIISLTGKSLIAQTVADFENLTLVPDTSWKGEDLSGSFTSGNATLENKFVDWGGGITSWSGFAYTNMRDTTTQSYTNEFSAITGKGYNNSANYAVGYVSSFDPLPRIKLNGIAKGDTVSGFYVTNSTYGYLTMLNGGGPAKKFGGTTGTDRDWFAMAVYGYKDGVKIADSVLFYMADYRFANSAQDYIVKNWRWVDLTSLGKVDSLEFNMFSSDTGTYGINNPTYFCMDNLVTNHNSSVGVATYNENVFSVYPNPATDVIHIQSSLVLDRYDLKVMDVSGRVFSNISYREMPAAIDLSGLSKGIYFIQINTCTKKIVVQ